VGVVVSIHIRRRLTDEFDKFHQLSTQFCFNFSCPNSTEHETLQKLTQWPESTIGAYESWHAIRRKNWRVGCQAWMPAKFERAACCPPRDHSLSSKR
jgi:hypothetical protein